MMTGIEEEILEKIGIRKIENLQPTTTWIKTLLLAIAAIAPSVTLGVLGIIGFTFTGLFLNYIGVF